MRNSKLTILFLASALGCQEKNEAASQYQADDAEVSYQDTKGDSPNDQDEGITLECTPSAIDECHCLEGSGVTLCTEEGTWTYCICPDIDDPDSDVDAGIEEPDVQEPQEDVEQLWPACPPESTIEGACFCPTDPNRVLICDENGYWEECLGCACEKGDHVPCEGMGGSPGMYLCLGQQQEWTECLYGDNYPTPLQLEGIEAEDYDAIVLLSWVTEFPNTERARSDVDLHVSHPDARDWNDAPNVCSLFNATPEWSEPPPEHHGDNKDNYEIILFPELDVGEAGYNLKAIYYKEYDAFNEIHFGTATITFKIYVEGNLFWEGSEEEVEGLLQWTPGALVKSEEGYEFRLKNNNTITDGHNERF